MVRQYVTSLPVCSCLYIFFMSLNSCRSSGPFFDAKSLKKASGIVIFAFFKVGIMSGWALLGFSMESVGTPYFFRMFYI